MPYEFLDHISDVYVHVTAPDLAGIFSEAALATYEVMLDTGSVRPAKEISVDVEADDLEQLLYKWIDRLIYLFDAESFALSGAEVLSVAEGRGSSSISAKLRGEEYDPSAHGHRTGVKAMTYSLMRIFKGEGLWHAYFVLDI
ncbi:MAG: archease [Candidatus Methanomethylicia archaeon]|nr:archease [Candidatus Methanomethylicia archaeon]